MEKYNIPLNKLGAHQMFKQQLYVKENCVEFLEFCMTYLHSPDQHIHPKDKNPIFETDLVFPVTNSFLDELEKLDIFKELANLNYCLREEPRLISWDYDGTNQGAAAHYHHDGWDIGGQVSFMFLLKNNFAGTHMRFVEDSKDGFSHKLYSIIVKFLHYNKFVPKFIRKVISSVALYSIDLIYDIGNHKKLWGPEGSLFVFNADCMHKAHAVKNTKRVFLHCNFILDENEEALSRIRKTLQKELLGETSKKLIGLTNKK